MSNPQSLQLRVGVDVGTRCHSVAVGLTDGSLIEEFEIPHTAAGYLGFLRPHRGARQAPSLSDCRRHGRLQWPRPATAPLCSMPWRAPRSADKSHQCHRQVVENPCPPVSRMARSSRSGRPRNARQPPGRRQIPIDRTGRTAEPRAPRGFLPRGLSDACRPSSPQPPVSSRRPTTLDSRRSRTLAELWCGVMAYRP